jgi:hypothetical protein
LHPKIETKKNKNKGIAGKCKTNKKENNSEVIYRCIAFNFSAGLFLSSNVELKNKNPTNIKVR